MKKSFIKRTPANEEMTLQITSMADIFTIILVFLLKSYSTSAANITPSQGMMLAEAHAEDSAIEALRVEVSRTSVQIEGNPIVPLQDFQFVAGEVTTNGSSKSLTAALEKERKRQLLIAKNNTDVKVDARIVIVADQRTPYSSLKSVLASAAINGYTDFKLAVIRGE